MKTFFVAMKLEERLWWKFIFGAYFPGQEGESVSVVSETIKQGKFLLVKRKRAG